MTSNLANAYASRLKAGLSDGLLTAIAAVATFLPAQAFRIYQDFWRSIIAISVVQAEMGETERIARNQFIGAAVGGIVSLAGLVLPPCRNHPHHRHAGGLDRHAADIFLTRFGEVCWGAFIGLTTVWVADRVRRCES